MWFNLLALVDKSLWNFLSVEGHPGAFLMDDPLVHGRPTCLWTTVLLGIAILVFLAWTTLMDELELVQFSVHHQLPPCPRVIQSTVKFTAVLWTCLYISC